MRLLAAILAGVALAAIGHVLTDVACGSSRPGQEGGCVVMACSHKTIADHTTETTAGRLWTCSNCRVVGVWTESWGYFGNMECLRCWTAQIDFVHCSEACRVALAEKHGLGTKRPRGHGTPREKKPRAKPIPAWERKARAAGWTPPGGAS